MTTSPGNSAALLARRARVLSPTYQLFYEQPLQIVRAEGVWMYDEHGRLSMPFLPTANLPGQLRGISTPGPGCRRVRRLMQ